MPLVKFEIACLFQNPRDDKVESEFSKQERVNKELGNRKGKGKKSVPAPTSQSAAFAMAGPSSGIIKIVTTTTTKTIPTTSVSNTPASIKNPPTTTNTTPVNSTSAITTLTTKTGLVLPTMKEKLDSALADIMDQSNSDQLSSDSITQAIFKHNVLSALSDGTSKKRRNAANSVGLMIPITHN